MQLFYAGTILIGCTYSICLGLYAPNLFRQMGSTLKTLLQEKGGTKDQLHIFRSSWRGTPETRLMYLLMELVENYPPLQLITQSSVPVRHLFFPTFFLPPLLVTSLFHWWRSRRQTLAPPPYSGHLRRRFDEVMAGMDRSEMLVGMDPFWTLNLLHLVFLELPNLQSFCSWIYSSISQLRPASAQGWQQWRREGGTGA
jgi:hypothetical protein